MQAHAQHHRKKNHFVGHSLLALTLALCAVSQPFAADGPLPPILQPTNPETHIGKVNFIELITPDLASATRFYGSLFGWTFRSSDRPDYAEAYMNGYPVAGMMQKTIIGNEHLQPAWLTFISSANVDASNRSAVQHGAKVLMAPRDAPNRGRQAVLTDPQGAMFGMLSSTSGDPADSLAEPGEWIWSSLISSDPDTSAAFYQTVFNYEVFEVPAAIGKETLMLASEDYARASANSLPSTDKNRHSHWLNYVRVTDATAMVAKVVALGGHVLVEPRVDRHGGKVAIVSDPAGAAFGLLEWTGTELNEVEQ
ncbi:putative enzyme related to lactoylglutathione lyase [Oxalobacteraceae bacterium GrIS 2.11]